MGSKRILKPLSEEKARLIFGGAIPPWGTADESDEEWIAAPDDEDDDEDSSDGESPEDDENTPMELGIASVDNNKPSDMSDNQPAVDPSGVCGMDFS